MPSYCCAYGCKNNSHKKECREKHISFHVFPKDSKLFFKWVEKLNRPDYVVFPRSRICSDHFEEDCFLCHKFSIKKCLKPNSVPTKFACNNGEATRTTSCILQETLYNESLQNISISDITSRSAWQPVVKLEPLIVPSKYMALPKIDDEISEADSTQEFVNQVKSEPISEYENDPVLDVENYSDFEVKPVQNRAKPRKRKHKRKVYSVVPKRSSNVVQENFGIQQLSGCKLGSIPRISDRISKYDEDVLKSLCRVLNFRWVNGGNGVIEKILQFNGFGYELMTALFERALGALLSIEEKNLKAISNLFGLKHGSKEEMAAVIMDFLNHPSECLHPLVDQKFQPVVVLSQLNLDNSNQKNATSKRKRKFPILGSYNTRSYRTAVKIAGVEPEMELDSFPALIQDSPLVCGKKSTAKRKRTGLKKVAKRFPVKALAPKGKPLSSFPQIAVSINNASQSFIQRLHVVLFGCSDSPQVMKEQILHFDGFKFPPNSEACSQKSFLLSLVSSNMLKQYCDTLHISVPNDNPNVLKQHLMDFLMSPSDDMLTEDDSETSTADTTTTSDDGISDSAQFMTKRIKRMPAKYRDSVTGTCTMPQKLKKPNGNVYLVIPEKESAKAKKILKKGKVPLYNEADSLTLLYSKESKGFSASSQSFKLDAAENDAQVQSILGIVYKNRELVQDGLKPLPIHFGGIKTKLSENAHAKFMIVTLHYPDLEIIHYLIFLHGAVNSKFRRNILDFDGLALSCQSIKYKIRKIMLIALGYEITKRIAFILGLVTLKTDLSHEDLCDLILYYLIAPSQLKIVPGIIPRDFFQNYPKDVNMSKIIKDLPNVPILNVNKSILKKTTHNAQPKVECKGLEHINVSKVNESKLSQKVNKDIAKQDMVHYAVPEISSHKEINFRIVAKPTTTNANPTLNANQLMQVFLNKAGNKVSAIITNDSNKSLVSTLVQSGGTVKALTEVRGPQSSSTAFQTPNNKPSQPFVDFSKLQTLTQSTLYKGCLSKPQSSASKADTKLGHYFTSLMPSLPPNLPSTTYLKTTSAQNLPQVSQPITILKPITSQPGNEAPLYDYGTIGNKTLPPMKLPMPFTKTQPPLMASVKPFMSQAPSYSPSQLSAKKQNIFQVVSDSQKALQFVPANKDINAQPPILFQALRNGGKLSGTPTFLVPSSQSNNLQELFLTTPCSKNVIQKISPEGSYFLLPSTPAPNSPIFIMQPATFPNSAFPNTVFTSEPKAKDPTSSEEVTEVDQPSSSLVTPVCLKAADMNQDLLSTHSSNEEEYILSDIPGQSSFLNLCPDSYEKESVNFIEPEVICLDD